MDLEQHDPGMTEGEVAAALAAHGAAMTALPYTRAEPEDGQDHPGDRVFVFGVQLAEDSWLAVRWKMGYPSDDEMTSCKLRWQSVDGPVTRAGLEELARAR
jgi:hypothetical protein